jgi:hypothetical protein
MRRAHECELRECELRCKAVFGRANAVRDTDVSEALAALRSQLAAAEHRAALAGDERDALRESLDEAARMKTLMVAKLEAQRVALETHSAEVQARLDRELAQLRSEHEKLKLDVAKDIAMCVGEGEGGGEACTPAASPRVGLVGRFPS